MKSKGLVALIAGVVVAFMLLAAINAVVLTLVLKQQSFDHRQTQNGQVELQAVVKQVETHLDGTIRASIATAAKNTVKELGR